jgi:hypothetical protein
MSRRSEGLTIVLSFLLMIVNSTAFGSSFKAAGNYAVGNHPVAIAAGDFKGDGKVDLAVANSGSNTVSVLLGNGDGTFGRAADYKLGIAPAALVVADFNGDGRSDIVVRDMAGTKISVLLGNGNGSFEAHMEMGIDQVAPELLSRLQAQPGYSSGKQSASVVFADFNGDGQLDEAVATSGRNLVSVLLNVTEVSTGVINLIQNDSFETGSLSPWSQGRNFCSGACKVWAVLATEPRLGQDDAGSEGNLEMRQDFAATPTSSILQVSLWVRHPSGFEPTAVDFFYSDGADDEFLMFTSDSSWDSFDFTTDLAAGKSLSGFSVWGFGSSNIATPVTYVDGVVIGARN